MSIYQSLGVTPIINATGTFTRLSGTLMPPEVTTAMVEASKEFVCIEDLQFQAGKTIADLTGAEAAYVTSGAQAGIVLSIAACITGLDPVKMDQLPHTEGLKREVIMARPHRNHYDHGIEAAGAKIIEVGKPDHCTPDEIKAALSDQTVALFFVPGHPQAGVSLEQMVAIGRQANMPVVVDGAGRLDDPTNLQGFITAGADLVIFSGGKYIRGPQASGFVCGRQDLMAAIAWQHLDMDVTPGVWTAPHDLLGLDPETMPFVPRQGIGRGYKAGKEEIVGLITALRLFVKRDHISERAEMGRKLTAIMDGVADVPHLEAAIHQGPGVLPLLYLHLDEAGLGKTAYEVMLELKQGQPSIHPHECGLADGAIVIQPFNLQAGDDAQIVTRMREIMMVP
ncbi:MAG: aminotransferase class V-fold PLP-dependent enzyme [Chloroflexota bacterium]